MRARFLVFSFSWQEQCEICGRTTDWHDITSSRKWVNSRCVSTFTDASKFFIHIYEQTHARWSKCKNMNVYLSTPWYTSTIMCQCASYVFTCRWECSLTTNICISISTMIETEWLTDKALIDDWNWRPIYGKVWHFTQWTNEGVDFKVMS